MTVEPPLNQQEKELRAALEAEHPQPKAFEQACIMAAMGASINDHDGAKMFGRIAHQLMSEGKHKEIGDHEAVGYRSTAEIIGEQGITEEQRRNYQRYAQELRGETLTDGTLITPMPIDEWLRVYGPAGAPPRPDTPMHEGLPPGWQPGFGEPIPVEDLPDDAYAEPSILRTRGGVLLDWEPGAPTDLPTKRLNERTDTDAS